MKAKNTPPNIFSETYNGDSSGYHIGVGHYVFTDNRGSLMLESASKPLLATAKELNFQVRSINTATTLINGLRARRSDYTCVENQRPTQIMVVFLTRGSDAWLIEVHAASNDPKAEAFFLKIANSANAER